MTGTASTEANEFQEIYELDVIEIPTNVQVSRIDDDDEIYRTIEEKNEAIVETIKECVERHQPVLVGTVSIEKSESLSAVLKKQKIKHAVLNARYHEMEAQIISQAGVPGAVTIATNMAGRGTDIQLGGNADMRVAAETIGIEDEAEKKKITDRIRAEVAEDRQKVLAAGGLYVLGTERHESRRIDNQLRGRSGRQGDPGHSKFYLSLHDDLMRIFGQDKLDVYLQRLGLKHGEAISHGMVNAAVAKSQQRVEARNFDIRKNLLKFDNVMNDQRKTIFEQRLEFIDAENVHDIVVGMRHQLIEDLVKRYIPDNSYAEQWRMAELDADVKDFFGLNLPVVDWGKEEGIAEEEIISRITTAADLRGLERFSGAPQDAINQVERAILLQTMDHEWREHLVTLDHLRHTIGLRGYGQRDPLNEYKTEAFLLFEGLLARIRQQVTRQLMHVELQFESPPELDEMPLPQMQALHLNPDTGENEFDAPDISGRPALNTPRLAGKPIPVNPNDPETWGKVQRNSPCPCGSGKKFKQCHGAI
jgi:preprotein translocase subunit SecA